MCKQGGVCVDGFCWQATMQETARHYAKTAMQAGWWQWARNEVQMLENSQDGVWSGLKAMVVQIIKDAGYRPHESEFEV